MTHRLALERVDSLELSADIVIYGLEAVEGLFELIDDLLVLQDLLVVCKVDLRALTIYVDVQRFKEETGKASELSQSRRMPRKV